MKVCLECKFYTTDRAFLAEAHGAPNEPRCTHPDARSRDLVSGLCYCREERQKSSGCGPRGKLWEGKA